MLPQPDVSAGPPFDQGSRISIAYIAPLHVPCAGLTGSKRRSRPADGCGSGGYEGDSEEEDGAASGKEEAETEDELEELVAQRAAVDAGAEGPGGRLGHCADGVTH